MATHPHHVAAVLHLAGFLCGLSLYGMLLVLAIRVRNAGNGVLAHGNRTDYLPVLTGIFGVTWNAGAMVVHGLADFGFGAPPAALAVAAYAALGFLPAVTAHSIVRATRPAPAGRLGRWIVGLAYGLSLWAAALHVNAAARGLLLPSGDAFRLLTTGYVALTLPLVVAVRRQALWRRTLVVLALGVFGVSAIHLVDHQDFTSPVWLQIIGHHASIPLAVAILLQDYPFALGDILLKRMLSLGALVTTTLAGFFGLLQLPMVAGVGADLDRPEFVGALLALVTGVALTYPWIRARLGVLVDRIVLKRSDPAVVLAALTRLASEREDVDALVTDGGAVLTSALSAPPAQWDARDGDHGPSGLKPDGRCVRLVIPTAETPHPAARIGPLAGGRRFLAADLALLHDGSQVLARRIDAIRIEQERLERRWREQELARLNADAELRALRAQMNPHFLFNALTTIGYLVTASPDKAVHTLLRLTELLRRALRPDEDVVTLASELQMVEAYLDIERARFEERLRVVIDVPDAVKHARIPAFVLQPLVENAVKHGIAPSRPGGVVSIRARMVPAEAGASPGAVLELTVSDAGRERSGAEAEHDGQGIGLANVRRRLELAFGTEATLRFTAPVGTGGAEAVVTIPCPGLRTTGSRSLEPPSHETPSP